MANIDKITVQSYLEPNGEPELVENLNRLKKQFYGTKNGDLIEAIDETLAASIVTTLNAYGVLPVLVQLLANGGSGGGVSYDIKFTGTASDFISSNTTSSSVTISDASVEVLQDMQTLLDHFDDYSQLNVCGSFEYNDTTQGLVFEMPAVFRDGAKIDNATAKTMASSMGISDMGDKDVLLVRICCVYNTNAYTGSWIVYESSATGNPVKTKFAG